MSALCFQINSWSRCVEVTLGKDLRPIVSRVAMIPGYEGGGKGSGGGAHRKVSDEEKRAIDSQSLTILEWSERLQHPE